MLKIIYGTKKKNTINKNDLYYRAYCRVLKDYKNNPEQDTKPVIKKVVFYGVKVANALKRYDIPISGKTKEDAEYNFNFANSVMSFMALLTPAELIQIFNVDKDYDGDKYETKDYFYTKSYLERIGMDKPIGEEITTLLWEYCNSDIRMFNVNVISFMSDLKRLDGQPGIMEEWAADNGIRTVSTFTDSKGKQYQLDGETGKTTRVKKPKPRYLKIVGK